MDEMQFQLFMYGMVWGGLNSNSIPNHSLFTNKNEKFNSMDI